MIELGTGKGATRNKVDGMLNMSWERKSSGFSKSFLIVREEGFQLCGG
jgi:hypothetical protein